MSYTENACFQSLPSGRGQSRAHFLGVAARVMRHVLVDHSRRRAAAIRGGDAQRVSLSGDVELAHERTSEPVAGSREDAGGGR